MRTTLKLRARFRILNWFRHVPCLHTCGLHRANFDTVANKQVNRDNMTVLRHPMTMQERSNLQSRAMTSLKALYFEGSSRRPGPWSLCVSQALWRTQERLQCAEVLSRLVTSYGQWSRMILLWRLVHSCLEELGVESWLGIPHST